MLVELCYPVENKGGEYLCCAILDTLSAGHKAPCKEGVEEDGHGHWITPAFRDFEISGMDYKEYDIPCMKDGCKEFLRVTIRKVG